MVFIGNNINILPTLYILLSVAIIGIGLLVFKRDVKKLSNIFFLLATFFTGFLGIIFGISIGEYIIVKTTLLIFFVGANVPLMLLFFSLTFTQQKLRITKTTLTLILTPYTVLMGWIYFSQNKVIGTDIVDIPVSKYFYFIYVSYVVIYTTTLFVVLYKRYRTSAGVFKTILRSIVYSTFLSLSSLVILILLYFLNEDSIFIFIGYFVIFLTFLFISIKKFQYHRWDVKTFFAELFVSFISLILAGQIFLYLSSRNVLIDVIVLIFFLISGYFLIKSVEHEAQTKDEIENLVKNLSGVNEELQILDKRKSEFVKISAHHLKTPLTVIKGYASMILEGSFGKDVDKEVEEAVQKIFDSSERLVAIIRDFMDISNIESGKMEYIFEPVNLKKLIEGVLEEMKMTIDRSGLDVSFNTDEIDGYEIKADSGKLRQVVSNLTDNAIKYTPHGHVHLFLKKDRKNKKLKLTITDTGVGMSQKTIDKLFEKFSRADDANKVNTGGSGLGLYVAKEIMKKHEAKIWIESPGEGKGSTFHLEFDAI